MRTRVGDPIERTRSGSPARVCTLAAVLIVASSARAAAQAPPGDDLPALPPPPPPAAAAAAQPAPAPAQPAATPAAAPVASPAAAAAPPASVSSASQLPAAAPETPAPAPPVAATIAPPPPVVAASCTPACREGFGCFEGRCLSLCNPACGAGERCNVHGECEAAQMSLFAGRPPPPPPPGAQRHDGFMLRLTLGFGGDHLTGKTDGAAFELYGSTGHSLEISSGAGHFSLDIGASPIDNLVIHARLAANATGEINPSLDGRNIGKRKDSSVALTLFGPALTYYFMPVDLYLTAAIGLSSISFTDGKNARDTHSGLGLNFDLGKEFWVGDDWGLGPAVRFWYTHVSDSGVRYNSFDWAILFSATYQ